MPLFLLSLILQVALIVHVMKTGRNTIWIWVVMMPIVGPVSYFLVEVLPELLGTRTARRAGKVVQKAIDPDRGLRQASAAASLADTVDAKIRLAAELQERSEFAAAIEVYRQALRGLYEHDPNLMLGLARAQFGAGEPGAARATLDALIDRLTRLGEKCRKKSLSLLVPMGKEQAYRYQEEIINRFLSAMKAYREKMG